jgi:hypothetical protein
MVTSREIRLKSRPAGMPVVDNFEVAIRTSQSFCHQLANLNVACGSNYAD